MIASRSTQFVECSADRIRGIVCLGPGTTNSSEFEYGASISVIGWNTVIPAPYYSSPARISSGLLILQKENPPLIGRVCFLAEKNSFSSHSLLNC